MTNETAYETHYASVLVLLSESDGDDTVLAHVEPYSSLTRAVTAAKQLLQVRDEDGNLITDDEPEVVGLFTADSLIYQQKITDAL